MAYNQEYVRNHVLYDIEHYNKYSINLTWILKAFGTNWNDGVPLVVGQNNSLDSFIDGFTLFLSKLYETPETYSVDYPEIQSAMVTNIAYNPDMDEDDIIVKTFFDIWYPLDTTSSKVVFSETQKKCILEIGKGINENDIILFFSGGSTDKMINSVKDFYETLYNTPFPANPSEDMYIRLGIARHMCATSKATVGTFYLKPEYVEANKNSLTGQLQAYPYLMYPIKKPKVTNTWYVDKTTGIVYASSGANRIAFHHVVPTNVANEEQFDHIEFKFYGTPVKPAIWIYNSSHELFEMGSLCNVNQQYSGIVDSELIQEAEYKTSLDYNYYKRGRGVSTLLGGNTVGTAASQIYPTYPLNYPSTAIVAYDSRDPENSNWNHVKYIDKGSFVEAQTKTIIAEPYKNAYDTGNFTVVDGIADDYLEIIVPGVDVINDVSDGTENITDVLSDGNNYNADGTNIIVTPGSDVTYEEVKDVVDPATVTFDPGVEIANGFMTTYICDKDNLYAIGQKFYNPSVIEAIAKAFTDPIKLIRSLAYIPIKIPLLGIPQALSIGGYDMETNAYRAKSMFYSFSYGSIDFREASGWFDPDSFDNYDEYSKYAIYIPFVGYQQLTANDVMGHNIRLDAKVNIVTGDILTTYWVDGVRRYIWGGNCLITLPVTDRDFLGGVGAIAGIGATVAAGIATGGAAIPVIAAGAGATAGAVASKTLAPQFATSGQLGGQMGVMGPQVPFIVQETLITNNFRNYTGDAYNFYGDLISFSDITLQNEYYAEVMSPALVSIGAMLETERKEIIELLSEGIWFRT